MTAKSLIQYFRSFLIKLNMIESQLGQLNLGGTPLQKFQRALPYEG